MAVEFYVEQGSPGSNARRLRLSQRLTQLELANLAGVSVQDVDSFEHNLPLRMSARCKIFKALLAEKALRLAGCAREGVTCPPRS